MRHYGALGPPVLFGDTRRAVGAPSSARLAAVVEALEGVELGWAPTMQTQLWECPGGRGGNAKQFDLAGARRGVAKASLCLHGTGA